MSPAWADGFFTTKPPGKLQQFSVNKDLLNINSPHILILWRFSGGSDSRVCLHARDQSWILELGRSLGEGNGNPLQYSCLEDPLAGGAWRATDHRVAKSWTWLRDFNLFSFFFFFSFFSFIFISWRLITSQHCSGFCHTLTWISHGVTCIPHPNFRFHTSWDVLHSQLMEDKF